jgi:ubiquinone/menaquinone biosynthesis C-methylase UbiE
MCVQENPAEGTTGRILHRALGYDLLVWLVTRGRDRRFRETLLSLSRVQTGESVLDVGCGTGSLAVAAKQRVGTDGAVFGIDASPEMIARANRKARKAAVDIAFQQAAAEALPFPDQQFDLVLSTLMLHHLPRKTRQACACEIRRVLRPGGRLLAVDFGSPSHQRLSLITHFHRHGYTNLDDIIAMLNAAGFDTMESGAVGMTNLHFVLAARPFDNSYR